MLNPYFLIRLPNSDDEVVVEVTSVEHTPADPSVGLEEGMNINWVWVDSELPMYNDHIDKVLRDLVNERIQQEVYDVLLSDCG